MIHHTIQYDVTKTLHKMLEKNAIILKTPDKMLLIIINGERDKRSFTFLSSHRIMFISLWRSQSIDDVLWSFLWLEQILEIRCFIKYIMPEKNVFWYCTSVHNMRWGCSLYCSPCLACCSVLGGIALVAQAIPPIPTHFSVAWSVCRLSVTFVLRACTVRQI